MYALDGNMSRAAQKYMYVAVGLARSTHGPLLDYMTPISCPFCPVFDDRENSKMTMLKMKPFLRRLYAMWDIIWLDMCRF